MALSEKLNKMLNDQMKAEFFSGYFYLSMSAWLSDKNLSGFAKWFDVQAQEERDHAKLLLNYILKANGKPEFLAIEAPDSDFKDALDIAKKTLAHEEHVTSLINNLMDEALAERDYKTIQLLQWYVLEQVEEEENARALIDRIILAKDSESGILFIDDELSKRQYKPITSAPV